MFDYEPLEQLDYIDYLSFADKYIETEVYEILEVLRW